MGIEVGVHLPNYDVSADGERFVFTGPVGEMPHRLSAWSKTGTKSSATASRTKPLESNYIAPAVSLCIGA